MINQNKTIKGSTVLLIFCWLVWVAWLYFVIASAWSEYNGSTPEALLYGGPSTKVCPDFSGFSQCSFIHFTLWYHVRDILISALLGLALIVFSIVKYIHFKRTAKEV